MYSPLQSAFKYLRYYLSAKNGKGHGIHSPFIYEFIQKVLNDKTDRPEFGVIEKLRRRLKKDKTILTVKDFGAGAGRTEKRSVASIADRGLKSKKFGQLFYRIVKKYQPQTILELGTSLGVTTSYLAIANPSDRVITMEGSGEIATIAKQNFNKLGLTNIEMIEGNFDDTLRDVLTRIHQVDFAFIDGNHRREPTERYFRQIISKTNNDAIIILDDIHWSREMEVAWKNIIANDSVTCSLDLYFIGIVFFRKEFKAKQHFALRF
jgi:predicted O-methyltransferase YrrM